MSSVLEPALSLALNPGDDPAAYWAAVRVVQAREPGQVWAALLPLSSSPDPLVRALVADLMRCAEGNAAERIGLLRELLAREEDVGVLDAIAGAFIEFKHPAVVELLLPLTHHAFPDVRLTAMQGLLQATEQVMDRFIELTLDPEVEVRNWTLFALSTLLEVRPQHAAALKEVFARALNETDLETKAEAVLGLARCRDRRAIEPTCIGLRSKAPREQYIDAARFLIDQGIGADVLRRALSKL